MFSVTTIKVEPESGDETEPCKIDNINTTEDIVKDVSIKIEPLDHEPDDNTLWKPVPENCNADEILDANCKSDGRYVCPICKTCFTLKGNLQRHLLNHKREKYECNTCFRQYYNQRNLDRHKVTHLKIKHTCDECGKDFHCASKLERHKLIHSAVKPFRCTTCERQYLAKTNFIKHLNGPACKKPEIVKELKCNVCYKYFEKKHLLQSHLKRHSDERPYECSICHSFYKHKSTLIQHEKLHKGIKPFSCKICNKPFAHEALIKPHMRTHTGEKPYQCDICKRRFALKYSMQQHIIRHAKNANNAKKKKLLVCDFCEKVFPKESLLKYHRRRYTH